MLCFMDLPRHYGCVHDAGVKLIKSACPPERGLLRITPEPIRREEGVVLETTKTAKKGNKPMKTTDKYIGLDVHKDTIAIAEEGRLGVGARQGGNGAARSEE